MSELHDRLDEIAERGEPRGADAVIAASTAEAERRTLAPDRSSTHRRVPALAAVAAFVAVTLVVGVLALRSGDDPSQPHVDTTSASTTTATTTPPTTTPSTTPPPTQIDFEAGRFEHVAWVDGATLVTASTDRPEPRDLAVGQVEQPSFSPDGRWLAVVRDGSLHVMATEGDDDRDLGANPRRFAWSPTGDRLAWIAGPGFELQTTDPVSGRTTAVDRTEDVFDFEWSPDGRSFALSRAARGATVTGFDVVDADGTNLRTVDFEPATRNYGAGNINPLLFASWQPDGNGVLVWIDEGGSGSIMQDGLALWLVPLDGSPAHDLGKTLVKREWIRWSPDGSRLAIVRSSGRDVVGSQRTVTVCGTDGDCTPAGADGTATMDPAWSPDGRQLTFVSHPAMQPYPEMHGNTVNWREPYAARQLVIANADGSNAHALTGAGVGVASPRWTLDGARILYVRDDALWSLELAPDTATQVLAPLVPSAGSAPSDAVYEPTAANGYPTWESLVTWTP